MDGGKCDVELDKRLVLCSKSTEADLNGLGKGVAKRYPVRV